MIQFEHMNLEQAKTQLRNFLQRKEITFTVTRYGNGEWTAECNEMPAIMTGGLGEDITKMDSMMREAVLTAANIDAKFSNDLLVFVGIESRSFLSGVLHFSGDKKAEYALA